MAGRGHIKLSVSRRLYAKSAGRCNLCGNSVVDSAGRMAEIAHIVGVGCDESSPRSSDRTLNDCGIDDYDNLILLCRNCHARVDDPAHKAFYTTEKLWDIKRNFEKETADRLVRNKRARDFLTQFFYYSRLGDLPTMIADLPYRYSCYFDDINEHYWYAVNAFPGLLPFENIELHEAFDEFCRRYNCLSGKLSDKSNGYNYYAPYLQHPNYRLHVDDEDNKEKVERDIRDSRDKLIDAWHDLCRVIERIYPNFPFHDKYSYD